MTDSAIWSLCLIPHLLYYTILSIQEYLILLHTDIDIKSGPESPLLPSMTNAEMICPDVTTNVVHLGITFGIILHKCTMWCFSLLIKSIVNNKKLTS